MVAMGSLVLDKKKLSAQFSTSNILVHNNTHSPEINKDRWLRRRRVSKTAVITKVILVTFALLELLRLELF